MASVQVRYIVRDVPAAIEFYTRHLGFHLDMHPAPPFAMLSRRQQEPGGWNRFAIQVDDLAAMVDRLRREGVRFRNDIVTGVGGRQIIVEDPSGNPVELFQPTR